MKVVEPPIYWVGRREPWWENLRRLPETDAVELLERHMWRITARGIDTRETLNSMSRSPRAETGRPP
ncbi:hypothetical protein [Nesterenkonia haasae]|uniref:hypothetical protein n=1 Tax=Nesterenkonia haasae TaxID=2587813 RepID=UPI00139201F3|nr:hypothetical protein [Nesterenkonia haasae]NDK32442.1 hypothetical protein [Nesterenkonia haasae]